MKNLQRLINSYSIRYNNKIKHICDPLTDLLNIPFFTYYNIDSEGRYCLLSNYPDECEYYYSEKMYLANPYLIHPDLIRSGYVMTTSTPSQDYLETLSKAQRKFQTNNPFLMIQKSGDLIEGFLFATNNNNPNFSHHYLNHLDLLKKFGRYFLQETESFLKRIRDDRYNLHEAKGDAFLERNPLLPLSNKSPNLENFLKSISHLSPREQECLELFRQGKSAQSTAAKLGLSRRTVEHYFESIKNKLNCHSKWDLLNR